MNLKIPHPSIEESEQTYLTASAIATATSLTCMNVDGFSANDYIVAGKIGEERTELRQVANTSGDTTINIDALDFPHSIDTPITYLKFNQIRIYMGDWSARYSTGTISINKNQSSDLSATTATVTGSGTNWAAINTSYSLYVKGKWYDISSVDSATQITLSQPYEDEDISSESYALVLFTLATTVAIQVDQNETIWDDTDGLEEDYYRSGYYNSTSLLSASMSYPVGGLTEKGYPSNSLKAMTDDVISELDPNEKFSTRQLIITWFNDAQRIIRSSKRKWRFQWTETNITLVDNQFKYKLPDDFDMNALFLFESDDGTTHTTKPLRPISMIEYYHKAENQDATASLTPENIAGEAGNFYIYPTPDVTGLTTATIHIQYYRKFPELNGEGDQTIIPNPALLKYYAAAFISQKQGSRDKYLDYMGLFKDGVRDLPRLDTGVVEQPKAFVWNPDGIRRYYSG